MKMFLSFIVLLNSFIVSSQSNFVLIDTTSSQLCKSVLYKEYKEKFEIRKKTITALNSDEKSIIKEIYTESQNDFLGKISNNNFLCDNTVNPYLQGLFNEVLTKNNINPNGYKILLSKDSEVNAYNSGDGTVVLNFGLFLSVENEDELVFVIAHEIAHQNLNHVKSEIESFAKISTSKEIIEKTKEIKSQKYGKATKANDLLKNIRYQNYSKRRKKEIAADSLGLAFYKKTLRNPKAAITLLEKFEHSDKDKDSLTIDDYKSIFEVNGLKIKEKYFDEEESLFKKYDSQKGIEIDSLKSHPDCTTRIKLIKNYLNNKFSESATNSKTFSEIKKNSVYQNLFNLYAEKSYGISLYETLKLYKNDKTNVFYKNMIYLNASEIYKSRLNYTINRYVPTHNNKIYSASLNRFISFVNNIKTTDFEILINNFKQ